MQADFSRVSVRTLWMVAVACFGIIWFSPGLREESSQWGWAFFALSLDGLMFAWLGWQCRRANISVRALIGGPPRAPRSWSRLWLVPVLIVVGSGAFWLLWYPLSFLWPDFVQSWALDYDPIWVPEHPGPSLVEMLSAVLFVPIWEEAVFRGVLLHRLCFKWGRWPAILVSSFVFGIFHADALGGFVFGVIMALLYVNTGSLWVPIACHALNNAIAFALEFTPVTDLEYDVARFQSEWLIGLAYLLVGGVALWATRALYLPRAGWVFPQPAVSPRS